jgi:DME family drug/metabolite transporter
MVSLGIAPVLLAALAATRARRLPSKLALATLGIALLGLTLVCLTSSSDLGPRPALGVALSIASGTTYALTTLVGRQVAQVGAPTTVATASTLAGAVVLAPLLLVGGPHLPDSPEVAGWLLYLGIGTMGLAYLSLYAGLRTVPAAQATLASLLEPVTAAVLAAIVLGEHLSPAGILGCLLVLAAVGGLALEE